MYSRVSNIASSSDFLETLATSVFATYEDPLTLSRTLILLPNRRSCRILQDLLLKKAKGTSIILPKIRPIGDVEEEELLLSDISGEAWNVPAPVSASEQRILLARLIQRWQGQYRDVLTGFKPEGITFDQASELAAELVRFLNEVEREQISWDNLNNLVPEHYAGHWQTTLSFLEILSKYWPNILQSLNKINPVQYRNQLMGKLAEYWEKHPPEFPVIAAGSTGSIPATRRLLKVIAGLPYGSVILPGLDMLLDEESWQQIEPSHPQYNLKRLLEYLGISRQGVESFGDTITPRSQFISELMRPAKTTYQWMKYNEPANLQNLRTALTGITSLDASTQQDEAVMIALIMREALETQEKKTILVTHDRVLANRVKQILRRWEIVVDDSAGEQLSLTPPAVFLMLLAEMVDEKIAPVPLLALLRHPLFAAQGTTMQAREYARQLEIATLRGMRPKEGFDGIFSILIRKEENSALILWLREVEKACQPFFTLMQKDRCDFFTLLKAHILATETLAKTDTESGASRLWGNEEGKQLAACLEELLQSADNVGEIETWSYTKFLRGLLESKIYRPRYGSHPRLAILSPQEARLPDADCVIMGGLNEGSWPPAIASDPWMSIPMRQRFGLPPKEKKIGMAAHDFCQLLYVPEVILTHARKVDGKPVIPSRWLQRLETLLKGVGLLDVIKPDKPWHHWAAQLHEPEATIELPAPAPVPPVESRPTALFVTQIEKLMRDPYAIYASHILKLKPLDPLDQDITHADFGNVVHVILAQFIEIYHTISADEYLNTLLALGRKVLRQYMEESPSAEVFWWSRFERIAQWFVTMEAQKRKEGVRIVAECEGAVTLNIHGKPFQLKARADRLETDKMGRVSIIDYKTGGIPEKGDIAAGFSCQMTLEGLIAEMGGFTVSGKVAALEYWRLIGGETPVETTQIQEIDQQIAEAREGVQRLLEYFARPDVAYPSEPWPKFAPRFSDYRHLARVKEWRSIGT